MFCRLYKLAIEKEMDRFGNVQRPSLVRHLKTCSACRAFYHQLTNMEQQLRTTETREFSQEQVEKVRAAIRQRLSETAPARSPSTGLRLHPRLYRRYAVSAAAVLFVALAGLYHYVENIKADPLTQFIRNTTELQGRVSVLARLPEQTFQAEMQKLSNDAQGAIGFITNCLPAAPINVDFLQSRNESTP